MKLSSGLPRNEVLSKVLYEEALAELNSSVTITNIVTKCGKKLK